MSHYLLISSSTIKADRQVFSVLLQCPFVNVDKVEGLGLRNPYEPRYSLVELTKRLCKTYK